MSTESTSYADREINVCFKNPIWPVQTEFTIIHFLKTFAVNGIGPGIGNKLIKAVLV